MLRHLAYVGWRYQCPICGWHFQRLARAPDGSPDAVCPRCWSAERNRLMWLYLERKFDLDRELRVLHVAPEPGLAKRLRGMANIDYLAVDLNGRDGAIQADLTDLPLPDDSFDLVLCSHVLEHIPDDRRAIRELVRVLRGTALLQHPVDEDRAETFEIPAATDAERLQLFGQHDHVRIYGRDFIDRLREAGRVETVAYADQLSQEERTRFRLERHGVAEPIYVLTP